MPTEAVGELCEACGLAPPGEQADATSPAARRKPLTRSPARSITASLPQRSLVRADWLSGSLLTSFDATRAREVAVRSMGGFAASSRWVLPELRPGLIEHRGEEFCTPAPVHHDNVFPTSSIGSPSTHNLEHVFDSKRDPQRPRFGTREANTEGEDVGKPYDYPSNVPDRQPGTVPATNSSDSDWRVQTMSGGGSTSGSVTGVKRAGLRGA